MSDGTEEITNYADVIDSRDVIARIEYLESISEDTELDDAEVTELNALTALAKEGEDTAGDWSYGATLVHDGYFSEYARELAEECYDFSAMGTFSGYIDWSAWARDLQMDYTSVSFDGQTYWVR